MLTIVLCGSAKAQQKNELINSLKQQIQNAPSDTTKARLQGLLAWQIKFTNPAEAIQLAEVEIAVGKKYQDYLKLADGYRMKGLQLIIAQKYAAGETVYDSCIEYAQKAGSDFYQASCFTLWAGMYGAHSDFDKSIELNEKGLTFAKKTNDPKIIAVLSNNLAENYKLTGRKLDSIQPMFKLAVSSFVQAEQWTNAAVVSSNLAQEYADRKEVEKAKKEILFSTELVQKDSTDKFFIAQIYNNYAATYLTLNQLDLAEKFAKKSKQLLEGFKTPDNLLLTVENLTKIYLAAKEYDKAQTSALQQLQLAQQQKSKLNISNAYKALAEVAQNKNEFKQSLQYFQLYKSWGDSVYNDKQQQNISNLETKSLLAQKEFEAKFFITQKVKENTTLKIQKWIAITTCGLLLLLGLLLFNAYKKKQKINNQLVAEKKIVEQQANEKVVLINEIHHRVKNNLTMLKSLLYLQARASTQPETKSILTEVQSRVQSMALVHQNLYEGNQTAKLNFAAFIQDLFTELSHSYFDKTKQIIFEVHGNCKELDIETAIPLALIMNELATNSFKYAFINNANGLIKVDINQHQNNLTILYSDNGIGLPNEFDLTSGGFGFKVLNILTQQLNATINYQKNPEASTFKITLPI